jgi:hypothetical protein
MMWGRGIAIAGCLLMLTGAAAAQDEGWEQVPSEPAAGAPALSATGSSLLKGLLATAPGKTDVGCKLVAQFAAETAKARDKGVSEESQLKTVDDPHGTLFKLASSNRLPSGTSSTMSATLHSEIVYVYEHREMTPAQLSAYWRQVCENPGSS